MQQHKLISVPRVVFLCVAVLMATMAFAQIDAQVFLPAVGAAWTQVTGNQVQPPQVRSLRATASMTALRMNLTGFHQLALTRNNIKFQRLFLPDSATTSVVGRPEMPVVRSLVAIPEGATVKLTVKAGVAKTFTKMQVFPAQQPVAEDGITETPFTMDNAFYKRDENYPPQLAQVSAPMKIRDTTVVLVEMAPMQYNPAQQQLTVYDNMDVELTFNKQAARLGAARLTTTTVTRPVSAVINEDLYRIIIAANLPWDYLIITPDAYVPNLQPLVNWKTARGLTVHVAKLSDVGHTVTDVKSYIKSAYDQHKIRYVLLVGDTPDIPPAMYNGDAASDFPYTLVSGADYLPDVALGRFSVHSAAELDNVVKKSVDYEHNPYVADKSWYKKALCVSNDGYFQDTSEWVAAFLTAHGYAVTKVYQSLGNATAANVANAVNNGRAIVNYRGHGAPSGWATTGFNNANVNALTNGAKLPAIISPTCLTGCFDDTSDCFSETWVKSYATGTPRGAVSYWGSSRISYGGYNDELCKGAYKALFDDGLPCMGDIVNKAKLYMLAAYGTGDSTALLELHLFNLFGDPELHVWTAAPK